MVRTLALLAAAAVVSACTAAEAGGPFAEGGHLVSGGVPPDGIVALSSPLKTTADQVPASVLDGSEHVLGVFINGEAVAYPVKVLDWHEIVNDVVGSVPIALTYCPLTGTGIGFDRRVAPGTASFGVSGLLCDNNLVLYDRITQSLWPQMGFESSRGELAGQRLEQLPVVEMSWNMWREVHPDTRVLDVATLEAGSAYQYDIYPYGSYYTSSRVSFPLRNHDERMHAKARVHGLRIGEAARIYAVEDLPGVGAVNDTLGGQPVLVFGNAAQEYATAYYRLVDGSPRTFEMTQTFPPTLRDIETGTLWDIHGIAISGPDQGKQLAPVEGYTGFFFAWATFHPGVEIWKP